MKIDKLMKALLDGKKVRVGHWGPTSYLYMKNGKILNNFNSCYKLDIHNDKFELYQDPKEQLYQWRYTDYKGRWFVAAQLMTKNEAYITKAKYVIHSGPHNVEEE